MFIDYTVIADWTKLLIPAAGLLVALNGGPLSLGEFGADLVRPEKTTQTMGKLRNFGILPKSLRLGSDDFPFQLGYGFPFFNQVMGSDDFRNR